MQSNRVSTEQLNALLENSTNPFVESMVAEIMEHRKAEATVSGLKSIQAKLTAKICHEVNKAFCETQGDFTQVAWERAPEWQRESALNGVKMHIDSRFSATPEDSHKSWIAEKEVAGWVYGLVKDTEKKTHPCMLPYHELPEFQKVKDALFTAVVHAMWAP